VEDFNLLICFFSDIHGNGYAFNSFLSQMERISPDKMIFGGDALGYYYNFNEILNDLRANTEITCIKGNHEDMLLKHLEGSIQQDYLVDRYGDSYRNIKHRLSPENISFIRQWNDYLDITIYGLRMGFFHGGPEDHINQRIYPDSPIVNEKAYIRYDYVFCGHTHHKHQRTVGKCHIINAGSLGQQRDGKGCSYILFDTDKRSYEYRIVEYDIQLLEKEIMKNESSAQMREKLVEVLHRKSN